MRKISGRFGAAAGVSALMGMMLVAAMASPAQDGASFMTLFSFNGTTSGAYPVRAALVQGFDGDLYGVTSGGGNTSCLPPYGCGTVFKVSPAGTFTTLFSFDGANGQQANALVLGADGNFYGTSPAGGVYSEGTVFRITAQGKLTTLHSFNFYVDGAFPVAALMLGTDGNFYGTTSQGEATDNGTIFRITPGGKLTTLHAFTSLFYPLGPLIEDTRGNLYGTSLYGDTGNCQGSCGTVFRLAADGVFTILYSFSGPDGAEPYAAMIQGPDGSYYGTTLQGGAGTLCPNGCGTVFKVTPAGILTTLHSFDYNDGANPQAGLTLGSDGNFYGATAGGGSNNYGTVFRMSPAGALTTIHSFDLADGEYPLALTQDTNGNLYGTTSAGGTGIYCNGGCGTIYGLAAGLSPFVETVPASARVGVAVKILGTKLEGSTSVTFNGTAVTFRVISSSLISATVPTGATSGPVQVVTPSGTLTSNVSFQVLP